MDRNGLAFDLEHLDNLVTMIPAQSGHVNMDNLNDRMPQGNRPKNAKKKRDKPAAYTPFLLDVPADSWNLSYIKRLQKKIQTCGQCPFQSREIRRHMRKVGVF